MNNNNNNKYNIEPITGIYIGDRGDKFKTLISSVLKRALKKKKYLDILTDKESMVVFGKAFTSELVDPVNNYQQLEILGDSTANKFIVWYVFRRFPQLRCTEGVKIAARLKINYGSKQTFFKIAEKLGFWDFITATNELRQRKKKSLLEDVFEAFIGAIESILDNRVKESIGYFIVYKLLKSIFDEMDISLKYEDLYDAKTRLKELFDLHGEQLGKSKYQETRDENNGTITSEVYRIHKGKYGQFIHTKIGVGYGAIKSAQQEASQNAIDTLKTQGFVKYNPRIYRQMESGKKEEDDVTVEYIKKIMERSGDFDINSLRTNERIRYQSNYSSTLIAKYCKERNKKGVKTCLELGADPNIKDSIGLSPIELLFIGKKQPKLLKRILKKLIKHKVKLVMSKQIYDAYYKQYEGEEYFDKIKDQITVQNEK